MPRPKQVIEADKARGGDIVLRRPWERGVLFIAGLAGAVALSIAVAAVTYWG